MLHRVFCLLLLATGLMACEAQPRRPNIVFIIGDDVGAEVIGAYGGLDYKTPNIDRMAADGAMFTHAYAYLAVCEPQC